MDNKFNPNSNNVYIQKKIHSFIKLVFLFRDLIITSESRPPTVAHSSRTINNGRTSTIPPPSDYEMIIGLLFSIRLILINIFFVGKGRTTSRPSSATKHRYSANDTTRRDNSLPKSSRTIASAKPQRSATTTVLHQCANCNKSYDDKRNYDIHKLYCRT